MRTEEITIYEYNELSEEGKEKAIEWFRGNMDYFYEEDNRKTLSQFQETYPIAVKDWQYDQWSGFVSFEKDSQYHYGWIDFERIKIWNLKGIRLMKWIINNLDHDLHTPKIYYHSSESNKKRYSKLFLEKNLPTGYYLDYNIRYPLYEFLKNPDDKTTLYDLMKKCLDEWLKECKEDVKSHYCEEYIKEFYEINEYEFYESGKPYFKKRS